MAVSKVAYDGHTLIDLTGDTATAADVTQGKTFHLANGEQATGTNTGGITPTGTLNITANGTYDVTSYAAADVNVPVGVTPSFPRTCAVTITLDNTLEPEETFDLDIIYRGFDASNRVVWKHETYTFTDGNYTVTKTFELTATDTIARDGIFVAVGDGGGSSNITSAVNCYPVFTSDDGTTGTEHTCVILIGSTASFTVYYANA